MRRAISWFDLSLNTETPDEEFIFLWISFNAAYGVELRHPDVEVDSPSEFQKFSDFLRNILDRDIRERDRNASYRKKAGRQDQPSASKPVRLRAILAIVEEWGRR